MGYFDQKVNSVTKRFKQVFEDHDEKMVCLEKSLGEEINLENMPKKFIQLIDFLNNLADKFEKYLFSTKVP